MTTMAQDSTFRANRELVDASKLSFATANCCFAVGIYGLLLNCIWPGYTSIDGMLVVGVLYLVMGVAGRMTRRDDSNNHTAVRMQFRQVGDGLSGNLMAARTSFNEHDAVGW